MPLALIVHGGAKEIPAEQARAHEAGCSAAAVAGWEALQRGGSALDAVEAAIRVLEADPTFNAGYGSALTLDGDVQMDAAMMEGTRLDVGAVGAIQGVRHPISVARRVLEGEQTLLVAGGARRFAAERGAELCHPDDLISPEQRASWEREHAGAAQAMARHDTVGCVALDRDGTIAAGTSTGGTGKQPGGRVGDSPLAGCGFYAESRLGGCSTTGDGEAITRVVLAKVAVDFLQDGRDPQEATRAAIAYFAARVPGEAGCIMLDPRGRVGWAHNSPNIAVAWMTPEIAVPVTALRQDP